MNDSKITQLTADADGHWRAGRVHEAAPIYQQLVWHSAQNARAHHRLGEIALMDRRLDLAERHFAAARAADPMQARDLLRSLSTRVPDVPEAWLTLGLALGKLEDFDAAIAAYEAALRLQPNCADAFRNLAAMYFLMMRWDRAFDCVRMAAECSDSPADWSNYVLLNLFATNVSPSQAAAAAESWDARFGAPVRESVRPPAADASGATLRDPERPLRIGFVSPCFYQHSNGLFSEPVLSRHDRARFHVVCYSDVTRPDENTERFRRLAMVYRETAHLSDEELAHLICADGIDILVDLNSHMKGSRLGVFARHPAPVQVTYLAYPFTCGVRGMDYRVTDAVLDPPGQDSLGPEALLRLRSSYWVYRPNPAALEPVRRLPARSTGRFTFASLNYTPKLNNQVVAAWAGILNQLPNARLLLLADSLTGQKAHLARLFADAGLDPTRLEVVGPAPQDQYLQRYLGVDLCLDPFPYGGGTTTLDALWMGVPVLTLAGSASYRRLAASSLARVGLGELVTHCIEEYQQLAVTLARDRSRLEGLRRDLRDRVRRSVLCDEVGWVADYERGLLLAWRRFCEGLTPAEIDLA